MKIKCPCKECLVYPACIERCDKLDKHKDKLINIIKYSGAYFSMVVFGLFVLTVIILCNHEVKMIYSAMITIPISLVLIFSGMYVFAESYGIANHMLKRYP